LAQKGILHKKINLGILAGFYKFSGCKIIHLPQALILIYSFRFIHLTEFITPVSCEDAVNLVIAADQLLVDSLRQYCKLIIKEKVTEENVWTVLDKLLSFNLTDVAEACNSVIK